MKSRAFNLKQNIVYNWHAYCGKTLDIAHLSDSAQVVELRRKSCA